MNQSVANAAHRHIIEIEKRVAEQSALVDQLVATNRDATNATRTLRVLQQALSLTKEHLRFAVRAEVNACLPIGLTAKQQTA